MNSLQRRKATREFPHVVKIIATTYNPWFIHDEKIYAAQKWCRQNFKGKHRYVTAWDHAEFKFAKEQDAVVFALRWL